MSANPAPTPEPPVTDPKTHNIFDEFLASQMWSDICTIGLYLADKMSEESSWRGLIGIASGLGIVVAPDKAASIIALGMALCGVINFLKKDKSKAIAKLEEKVNGPATPTTSDK